MSVRPYIRMYVQTYVRTYVRPQKVSSITYGANFLDKNTRNVGLTLLYELYVLL